MSTSSAAEKAPVCWVAKPAGIGVIFELGGRTASNTPEALDTAGEALPAVSCAFSQVGKAWVSTSSAAEKMPETLPSGAAGAAPADGSGAPFGS